MLSNLISWSAAAFGGAPFRLSKSTALDASGWWLDGIYCQYDTGY